MPAFIKFLVWFGAALILAALQYIGGRILLPEMGLTPPGWWAWWWISYIVEMPLLTIWAAFRSAVRAEVARRW